MSRKCNCSRCKKLRKDKEAKEHERAMRKYLREVSEFLELPDGERNEERYKNGGKG